VWCELYSHGIVASYFFENAKGLTVTLNAEQYKVMLATFLHIELHPHKQYLLWFQHDGTTAHTAEIPMQVLRRVFLDRIISRFGDINCPHARLTMQNQTTSSGTT
jgi:hypothetical protein